MVFRRCPQCGSTSNDTYGFCIKCGYEFPKIEKSSCPACGYTNPEEADFCVKCGTPLIFKNQINENNEVNPVVIRHTAEENNTVKPIIIKNSPEIPEISTMERLLVIFGYVFSILGGLLGLIIGIYLSTKKNPKLRRHGHIQLSILAFYVILIMILFLTGSITPEMIQNYTQLISGNFTRP